MLGGLLLFLVGTGAIIGAIQLKVGLPTEPQPGFFPFVGGIVLVILSAIIFVQGWLKSDGERVVFGKVGRPALILAVMVALDSRSGASGLRHLHPDSLRVDPAYPQRQVMAGPHHHKPLCVNGDVHSF